MSLTAFLGRVVRVFDEAAVPYMVTGSLAAAYYAAPRATQVIDVVIDAQKGGVERVVQGLLALGCYVDRHAALEALETRGQFNAIEPDTGWKVDLIVRKERPFSKTEFARRERASLLGVEVALASLEDVVIAKLEWSRLGDSELQRRDVAQLLERAWDRIDHAYLERWITELGLDSEWKAAKERSARGTDSGEPST